MDYYHHPEKIPTPPRDEDRGGFYYPFDLVVAGWHEWQKTGRMPHPKELSDRLNTRWRADLQYFGELIERGRPKDNKPAGGSGASHG